MCFPADYGFDVMLVAALDGRIETEARWFGICSLKSADAMG
jgi:hypothetical protein